MKNNQTKWINDAREFLKPTPVNGGKLPPWFKKVIRSKWKIPREVSGASWLIDFVKEKLREAGGKDFFDHWGTTKFYKDGRISFVSEPYISTDSILAANYFCEIFDLEIVISPNSWWYPGYTTRILISEKRNSELIPVDP